MSKFRKVLGASAVLAAALLSATAAQAVPFTSGSFGIQSSVTSGNTNDVTTATVFTNGSANFTTGGGFGSFFGVIASGNLLPLATPNTFDFGNAASFNTTLPNSAGTFTASSIITGLKVGGPSASAQWTVVGTFAPGAAFGSSPASISAEETWTCNQTGGLNQAISCSGTFFSPFNVTVPEPLTISLFGAGLIGAAAARRRRKAALAA